jgi:hypothetical protein
VVALPVQLNNSLIIFVSHLGAITAISNTYAPHSLNIVSNHTMLGRFRQEHSVTILRSVIKNTFRNSGTSGNIVFVLDSVWKTRKARARFFAYWTRLRS